MIYANGSLNSSAVGRYEGASCNPWGRILLLVSRLAVGCPLLSTLVISSGWECIALRGCCVAAGLFAFVPVVDLPRMEVVLLFVPLAGEALMPELDAAVVIGT